MGSAATAWIDAEEATWQHLVKITGSKAGKSAFLGDQLRDDTVNVWTYQLSGGDTQAQNFQMTGIPPCQYIATSALLGQWIDRKAAMKFAGKVMNDMPAYKNPSNTNNRGLPPNVNLFEMTEFPIIESRIVSIDETGRTREYTYYMLRMDFRVEFGIEQN